MTAVPSEKRKTKNPFQLELDQAIALRKSRGLAIGISDSDSNKSTNEAETAKKKDELFVKEDNIYEEKHDDEKDDYSDDYEFYSSSDNNSDNELLKEFLKPSPKKESKSWHQQNSSKNSSFQKNSDLNGSESCFNGDIRLSQTSSFSLSRQKAVEDSSNKYDDDDNDPLSLFLKENSKNLNQQKTKDPDLSENSTQIFAKKKVTFQPIASNLSPRSPTENKLASRQQTPYKNKETVHVNASNSIIDDLLDEIKPRPNQRKLATVENDQSRPQPRPRRRHESGASTLSEESQTRVAVQSSDLAQVKEISKTEDDVVQDCGEDKKSIFPSLEKPKIDTQAGNLTASEALIHNDKKETVISPSPSLKMNHDNKKKHQIDSNMSSSTEDLLEETQVTPENTELTSKTSTDEITSEKPSDQSQPPLSDSQQKADLQERTGILIRPTENEEELQDTFFSDGKAAESLTSTEATLKCPASARKSARKSPRTPPVNYKGLGSLDGLQQLRTLQPTTDTKLNSGANVRSTVYMQWLADREKKLQKRKKHQKEAEEKENEKKQKDIEERALEGESARRAWLKNKEDVLKKEAQKKRKEEKQIEREKRKQEEEKRADKKKAERVREKYLEEARIRHKQEMKRKKQEEKMLQEQEKEKKKKNEEELNKWMENRSKQWEIDRKKEIREKKVKERETKKAKEEKAKTAEDKYAAWRETKEQREREKRRVNRHDENRPPWSPANKVIPRIR